MKTTKIGMLAVMAMAASATLAQAAVAPYSQDFQAIGAGGALPGETIGSVSSPTTNTWTTTVDGGGNHAYQSTLVSGTGGGKGMSTLNFSNLGPATPSSHFEMSVIVTPSTASNAAVNYTEGLWFLANSGTSTNDSYVADLNISAANGGRIRLVEFTGATAVVYPSSTQSLQPQLTGFALGKSYLLDVVGNYDASSVLTINFTASEVGNSANSQTVTLVDSSPRTGQNFGMYASGGSGGGGTQVATFDNLTVAPEPASLTLLGFGGTLLFLRKRGRRGNPTGQA